MIGQQWISVCTGKQFTSFRYNDREFDYLHKYLCFINLNKQQSPKASYGYGGKFGVQKDRIDKVGLWLMKKILHLVV